jgi:CHASE2 domain-containing sensor protein
MLELRIQQIERFCVFELSWGQGQRISITHTFPEALMTLYHQWQQAYINHYRSVQIPVAPINPSLRGQKVGSGALTSSQQIDWHGVLIEAGTHLLREFHRWLHHEELYELRKQIAEMSQGAEQTGVTLFLTCIPLKLARLPWETWEIGAEFGAGKRVRMIRTSANVREPSTTSKTKTRVRPRILAILGDDTGLNFEADKAAVEKLNTIADIKFVGWQPGKAINTLRTEIGQAIADPKGWDVLFFAGHSNETAVTGGELGIAPNATMRISELEPKLLIAKERGLQFALFNSCNGLSLAESLISLGLSQVAVMREPIHDRVAHEFLVQFMQSLAEYKDVHEALLDACQFLKVEAHLTYPSAYLIPSLFCYPQVSLFRIPLPARQRWIRHWIPKRYEAVALAGLTALSLLPPVQDWLLDRRVWMQVQYRQLTQPELSTRAPGQQPANAPPILLVRIDDQSISRDEIEKIERMDREYLARLVTQLVALDAKVIGLDYVLDYPDKDGEQALVDAIHNASQTTKFVFATKYDQGTWLEAKPEFRNAAWNVPGTIDGIPQYLTLLYPDDTRYPFSYWLTWLYQCCVGQPFSSLEQLDQVATGVVDPRKTKLVTSQMQPSFLNRLSYSLHQMWFHPIMDYSIPLQQVYTEISAWKVLQNPDTSELENVANQVVLIVPGGYSAAGIEPGEDNFTAPSAMTHWYLQRDPADFNRDMTGGEYHAYAIHQLLNNRFVTPIPDLWLILLAALLGRATVLLWRQRSEFRLRDTLLFFISGIILYGVLSLHLYLLPNTVLLPIVLPAATYGLFTVPSFVQRRV